MKRILDIGQCDHDHGLLTKLATKVDAQIVRAFTAKDALEKLDTETFDLVWVNRMLDADNSFGIEIVKKLKSDNKFSHLPVMLISNFDEAQAEAQKHGALSGFGKDHLNEPTTEAAIRSALK